MSQNPVEIVVAPIDVYIAPVGEAFPDVDETPAGNWVLIGTNGKESYAESGVMVDHPQTIDPTRVLGATAPVKFTRSSEDLMVGFTLFDLKPIEYARLLNENAVTSTAAASGTPGHDDVNIYRGLDVAQRALLLRIIASALGLTFESQYEFPIMVQDGSPQLVYVKNAPVGLQFQFKGVMDLAAAAGEELGKLVVQDAVAL